MVVTPGNGWGDDEEDEMATNRARPREDGADRIIDSVAEAERTALDAVRRFLDTVNNAFPDVGPDGGARQRIIDSAMDRLKIPAERTFVNIARYGAKALALVAKSEDYGHTWTDYVLSNLPMVRSKNYSGTLSTGQPYFIKFKDGRTVRSSEFLGAELGKMEGPAAVSATQPSRE